jgi:hypothetical protein
MSKESGSQISLSEGMKNKLSILSCQLSEEAARAGAEVFVVLIAGVGLDSLGVGLGANAGGEQGSDYPFAQDHQEQSWLVGPLGSGS